MRMKCWTCYNSKFVYGRSLPMLCRKLGSLGYTDGVFEVYGTYDEYLTDIRYDTQNQVWEQNSNGWKRVRNTKGKAVTPDIEEDIIETLRKYPDLTAYELAGQMGMEADKTGANIVSMILRRMRDEGKTTDKCVGGLNRWRLTD